MRAGEGSVRRGERIVGGREGSLERTDHVESERTEERHESEGEGVWIAMSKRPRLGPTF